MAKDPTTKMEPKTILLKPGVLGFRPEPAAPPHMRGDTGKGPLPKTACLGDRHVKLGGK